MTAETKPKKPSFSAKTIQHIDITKHNVVPLVDAMQHMAFSARDLHRAADIYDRMLRDKECGVILCLAGSLISAGLKKVFVDMIRNNMVDAIVSTGANIIDQDFFEALGFKHYMAPDDFKSGTRDGELRDLMIDRIYDTFIDEEELRVCDETTQKIFDELEPRPVQLARNPPRVRRLPRAQRRAQVRRQHHLRSIQEGSADLRPGLQRLLGGLWHRRPPARPRRSAQSQLRQRQGFLRADAAQDQERGHRACS